MSYDPKKCRIRINGELVKNEVGFSTIKECLSVAYHVDDKADFERYSKPRIYKVEILYDEEVIEKFDSCEFMYNDYHSSMDRLTITSKFSIQ